MATPTFRQPWAVLQEDSSLHTSGLQDSIVHTQDCYSPGTCLPLNDCKQGRPRTGCWGGLSPHETWAGCGPLWPCLASAGRHSPSNVRSRVLGRNTRRTAVLRWPHASAPCRLHYASPDPIGLASSLCPSFQQAGSGVGLNTPCVRHPRGSHRSSRCDGHCTAAQHSIVRISTPMKHCCTNARVCTAPRTSHART